ncbi:MAG: hypothetical protein GX113_10545 [Actinobacteria bacterium]|jgi:hypothetical protein|nr:hypothetical protein [Actinomycetota bacterium]
MRLLGVALVALVLLVVLLGATTACEGETAESTAAVPTPATTLAQPVTTEMKPTTTTTTEVVATIEAPGVTTKDLAARLGSIMAYQGALARVASQMESIKSDWAELEITNTSVVLRNMKWSVNDLEVPLGCQAAQAALVDAMACYDTALNRLAWAKASGSQADFNTAWESVLNGDAKLALALKLADKVTP